MTTIDTARLRALAEAATPGPWEAVTTGVRGGDHWYVTAEDEAILHVSSQDGGNEGQREPLATYLAAIDPPTLIALLDRLEAAETLRSMADAYRAEVEQERDRLILALGRIHGYVQGAARRALPEEYAEWEKAAALAEGDDDE